MKRAYGIASGKLRERVEIQTPTFTQANDGSESIDWSTVAVVTVWAHVRANFGKEYIAALNVTADMLYTVVMRYTTAVTPQSRIRLIDANVYLQVIDVRNIDERNRRTELTCKQMVKT